MPSTCLPEVMMLDTDAGRESYGLSDVSDEIYEPDHSKPNSSVFAIRAVALCTALVLAGRNVASLFISRK